MTEVASRELRNDTAGVLRRVSRGEELTVTTNGRPIARLVPLQTGERRWLSRDEFVRHILPAQADPGLRKELDELGLDELVGDTDSA